MTAVSTGMLVVFGLILVALVLFVTELIPNDMTAVGVLVSLAVLEPLTGVPPSDAIAGFASSATVTIVAMYILSEGVQRTGIVERLGVYLARITRGDEQRLLAATVGTTGLSAGIVNNTPVVAVFIPMITGLADRAGVSPSKLLLPLSYAAMLGGTLTLIGTSTNILASDIAVGLSGEYPSLHRISMFEFTPVGLLALVAGAAYLLTVGRLLTPARVPASQDLTEEFELDDDLSVVAVPEASPLVGRSVADLLVELDADGRLEDAGQVTDDPVDDDGPPTEGDPLAGDGGPSEAAPLDLELLQVDRDGESFLAAGSDQTLAAGDLLTLKGSREAVGELVARYDLRRRDRREVDEGHLTSETGSLVEAVLLAESRLVGETVAGTKLAEQFDTTVLAVRRGEELLDTDLEAVELAAGDTLLLAASDTAVEYLADAGDIVVTETSGSDDLFPEGGEQAVAAEELAPLSPKTPVALAIMAGVIGVAAATQIPIVIAALGGVFAMVVSGVLTTSEAYDAVSWNIVFLLAGVLPLGVAMQRTGGDALIADVLVGLAGLLPVVAVLLVFYLVTALLANIVTPVASVVLMIPVAVDTASRIGASEFTFLLGVMFGASGAFMTPIGYQTNLMVYGPGGYKFTDYLRVGGPLQLLLALVVTGGLVVWFGV